MPLFTKLVLTGACGALGSQLRAPLSKMTDHLLSVDISDCPEDLHDGETFTQADIGEMDQVLPLMKGADMVVHFAGIPDEAPFEKHLGPSIVGSYNIWEAAHKHGVRRIVYASSVHAVGMHPSADGIDLTAPHRPDTYYGLGKCFTENLARLYWEKRGLEAVCLRIFSCQPEPANMRALGTWLSYGDLIRLVERSLDTPTVGFTPVHGVSNNDRSPVNNHQAAHLGYKPLDNAEDYYDKVIATARPADPQDPSQMLLGGPFAIVPLGESGVAMIKKLGERSN